MTAHLPVIGDALPPSVATSAAPLQAPLLLHYWRLALRWKWVIVGVLIASLVIGLLATLLTTPKYYASSRIEISREQKNITNVEGVEPGEVGRDLEFYQTQYALLEARSLAERVARELRLADRDDFFTAHGEKKEEGGFFFDGHGAGSAEAARRFDRVVRLLRSHIGISPIRGSSLIDIGYTSASPAISAEIANSVVRNFMAQSTDRRFASTADARQFLERRLTELRSRVEASERDLVRYGASKGIVPLSRVKDDSRSAQPEQTLVAQDLVTLNEALNQATADRIAAESRAQREHMLGASTEALNNQAINGLVQRRAEAAADYSRMMVQFDAGYPPAQALQRQIESLDAAISREQARVAGSRGAQLREARSREDRLKSQVNDLSNKFARQQRDSIQYGIYQREADTNRQLYDALLQRYKEIGVAGIGASNIAVVDSAKLPARPSSPNLMLNLGIALFLGLMTAIGVTVALNQIDEGLRDPAHVQRLLQVPLIGSVPHTTGAALELLREPKSAISEAYFSIRSNLAFTTDHGVPRSLVVTSTRPAEGKTTTSIAIAAVLGRTGKRVVMIDGDMRSPSIHRHMGVPNTEGLSNVLAGDDDWQRFLRPTDMPGVSFITAGPQPPSAAELLSTERTRILVGRLLDEFDHVIIDSPPILGLADAPLLASATEGALFVVEANGVPIRGIQSAIGRIRGVHTPILGVILTKLKEAHAAYGYGYDYSYAYGSRSGSEGQRRRAAN